jgi:TRAP transporter TAXI family solute receptor
MSIRLKTLVGAVAAAAVLAGPAIDAPARAQNASYIMGTAGTGGTYYPVGVAIATLTSIRVTPQHGVGLSAISSAGSGENVRLMREKQIQFSILQGIFGSWAWTGTGQLASDGPQRNLRSVMQLWPNVEHFAIRRSFVKTGTMQDLVDMRGRGFAMGARNSGTEGSNRHLLQGLGIADPESHFNLQFLGFAPGSTAFQNGTVDAVNPGGGPPVGAHTQLAAAVGDQVVLLNWTDEQIRAANGAFEGLWTPFVLPAGTYPGQTQDVRTVGQPNFLAVNADVPDEHVYLITKAVFENLPFLNNIHPATEFIKLETALDGLPMPLHPGAIRYYEERGLTIPARLRP